MWVLYVILGLIALLAVAASLPVTLIVKNDENNNLLIRYRFLGKTYGQIPKPETALTQQLKKSAGITRVQEKMSRKEMLQDTVENVKELCGILLDFLNELTSLLRHCTAKVFRVHVVCATDDAASTAITYGVVSTAVYGLSTAAANLLKIRKKGLDLNIGCDFSGHGETRFRYEFQISVRIFRLLPVLVRLVLKEARRENKEAK